MAIDVGNRFGVLQFLLKGTTGLTKVVHQCRQGGKQANALTAEPVVLVFRA